MNFAENTNLFTKVISQNVVYYTAAQKMKFSIKDFFSKCDQIRRKLTEEILNGKLHFLCSVSHA